MSWLELASYWHEIQVPGGIGTSTNGQVLFNSSGSVAGDAGLTYDAGADTLTTGRVLVGDGGVAAPSVAFSSATGAGWSYANTQPTLSIVGVDVAAMDTSVTWKLRGDGRFGWTATGSTASAADTVITRGAPATLQLGAAPNATPVANTLIVGESGSGDNIAGANGVIQSGAGTGSGTGSQLLFKTPTAGGSGAGAQTQTTRMTIDENGVQVNAGFFAGTIYPLGYLDDTWSIGTSVLSRTNLYLSRATLGSKSKTLTDATPTAFATVALADGTMTGGEIIYRVTATIAGEKQNLSGRVRYSAIRDNTDYDCDISEVGTQTTSLKSGTLAGSITCTATAGVLTFSANFDSSLTAPTVTLHYRFDSTDAATSITPL